MNRALLLAAALALLVPTAVLASEAPDRGPEIGPPDRPAETPQAEGTAAPDAPATPAASASIPSGLHGEPIPTYWEESFANLEDWRSQHPDLVETAEWRIAPLGQDGDPAALLASEDGGLPARFHTALAGDPVDLTPVPGLEAVDPALEDPTVEEVRDGDEALETQAAGLASLFNTAFVTPGGGDASLATGTLHVPEGPAYLTLAHRFAFDDVRDEDDHALSGFSLEAREPDGDWTPLEPAMVAQAAREAKAPSAAAPDVVNVGGYERFLEATTGFDGESIDPCRPFDVAGALATYVLGAGASNCTAEPFVLPGAPAADDPLVTLSEAVSFQPVGEAAGTAYPELPRAYVEPLDAYGYTGTSGDRDDDGQPDLVTWAFDLSPWAGDQLELRLRAAGDTATPDPDGLWALDHAQIRGAAHASDLRLEVTHPDEDDLAAPGEAFPITARVQNVGLAQHEGPFDVEITVRDHAGQLLVRETVAAEGTLGFLDTAEATLTYAPTRDEGPLQIDARLTPPHADAEPRNDEDQGLLPVGVDRSVDLDVTPSTRRVEPGEPFEVTVAVENEGNVPLADALTIAPHQHDPSLETASGPPLAPPAVEAVQIDRSPDRHPLSAGEATHETTVTFTVDEARPVQVHATYANATGSIGVGVGTPAPPLVSAALEDVEAGPPSFSLSTDEGDWRAWADSDVSPRPGVLEPGDVDGSAWVPLEHESTLLRPEGGQNLTSGFQDAPEPGNDGLFCTPEFLVLRGQCIGQGAIDGVGTPLVLESPRGTQRVHVMAHDLPLHEASQAELSFLSSLVPPEDDRGVAEARVYVATDDDLRELSNRIEGTCAQATSTLPDEADVDDPCTLTNVVAVDETADRAVEQVFALEESIRCSLPRALDIDVSGDEIRLGSALADFTCPNQTGGRQTGACAHMGGVTQGAGVVCFADEPSRLEALAPMLAGTLVHRTTTPHAWQANEVDLDPWAGENVTLGIVYVGESDETTTRWNAQPYGSLFGGDLREGPFGAILDPLSGTIGYAPPGRAQGALLVDRVTVETDAGLALHPEDVDRRSNEVVSAAQDHEPREAQPGWRTIGYEHLAGLGDASQLLPSRAQVLAGPGWTSAEGADASHGLRLGVQGDLSAGVELFPLRLHAHVEQNRHTAMDSSPGDLHAPADDPAVTVLASPRIDLAGTEDPILRFRQHFDLGTEDGPQGVVEALDHPGVAAAFGLPTNATWEEECALGHRNSNLFGAANVTLEGLACLLEETREGGEPGFDVQSAVSNASVAEPDVAAGLFVQARVLSEDGVTEPKLVEPASGYRYPIADAGGFQPTLDYAVASPDTHPGYTTPGGPSLGSLAETVWNQPTYTERLDTTFAGTPAWAGDSDVDGDGEPDWVTSQLDLSPFAGEEIELEFVLVARQNQHPSPPSADEGTVRTLHPWSIDGLEVLEREDEGQVALEEIRWPNPEAPLAAPAEQLPVRFDVSTPTGVSGPIHGKAQLVDDDGCLRAEATNTTDPGTLAPGEETPLSMSFPAEDVDGTTPWTIRLAADAGQPPALDLSADVQTRTSGPVTEVHDTDARSVSQGATLRASVEDPGCAPDPSIVTVEVVGGQPQVTVHDGGDEIEIHVDEDGLGGTIHHPVPADVRALAITQGQDGDADAWARTLTRGEGDRTIRVSPAQERLATGLPAAIELSPRIDLEQARLWMIDPVTGEADPVWSGQLDALDERTVSLVPEDAGPRLVVATGRTSEDEAALGSAALVAAPGQEATDPLAQDDRAELTVLAAENRDLTVEDVTVSPEQALSIDDRHVTVTVANPGTRTLDTVDVDLLADGTTLTSWNASLAPGEETTFELAGLTVEQPTVVLKARANATELEASAVTVARSLVQLGEGSFADPGPGWRIENGTARFADPDTGLAPRDTIGAVSAEADLGSGISGLVARVNHSLTMEEGFDAGDVRLDTAEGSLPLASENRQALNELSPLEGPALTGQHEGFSRFSLDADTLPDTPLHTVEDATGAEALGEAVLDANEPTGQADCQGRTYLDDELPVPTGAACRWSRPLLPFPQTASHEGVFHLQPSEFLSSEETWTVELDDGSEYEFTVNEATSYVFLEAGRDLVAAAQEEGKLEIRFDEARVLDPFFDDWLQPMSVEVCARFMHVAEEDANALPGQRRCTGLTHDDARDQQSTRDWGRTILTVGNIPEAPDTSDERYNVVRLELSLEQDRGDRLGTGLMGPHQSALHGVRLQQPVEGWFVGPVTAEADDFTRTWTPDQQALSSTDPNNGMTPSELASFLSANPGAYPPSTFPDDVVEQSATLALTDVDVVERRDGDETADEVSTAHGIEEDRRPVFDPPILPCAWHDAGACEWTELIDVYASEDSAWNMEPIPNNPASSLGLLAASAPFAMNLTCSQPSALADIGATIHGTRGCTTSEDLPGMGVQALNATTIQEGVSDTCDAEIGPPVLWRTRCLSVHRSDAEQPGWPDPEGQSLTFRNVDAPVDPENPPLLRSRGHSLDYRLVVPLDLRHAAPSADAWATPELAEVDDAHANLDLPLPHRAEARVPGETSWTDVPICQERDADECQETWVPLDRYEHVDLSAFAGHQVELSLRFQQPHPMLSADEHRDGPEAALVVDGLRVDAELTPFVDTELRFQAGTDVSREGDGWTVRDVELFGVPIEANVGADSLESKLHVADRVHVHADPAAQEDIYMSVPANLTLHNQGSQTQTLPLTAVLEAREHESPWHASTSPAWTDPIGIDAPGECEATIHRTDDAADETLVELQPGRSDTIPVRVNFVPESAEGRLDPENETTAREDVLAECFPGQFDEGDGRVREEDLSFRLRVGVAQTPEEDLVASDDTLTAQLRVNPFLDHEEPNEPHRPGVFVDDLAIEPTRPSTDGEVDVSANLSLRDRVDRALDVDLALVDPVSDEVLASLEATDAEQPVTALAPYTTSRLDWTLTQIPEDPSLVRLSVEIARSGETVLDREHGWIAADGIDDHVDPHGPEDLQLAGDARREETDTGPVVRAETSAEDQPPLFNAGSGSTLAAAIGTDWLSLDASPPPLVTLTANWTVSEPDRDEATDPHEALSGWAVQVCHVDGQPRDGDCPVSTEQAGRSDTGRWAWRTVNVVQAPEGTQGQVADLDRARAPSQCGDPIPQPSQDRQERPCSEAAAEWANLRSGEDVLIASQPEGDRRTVTAQLTECSVHDEDADAGCPAWSSVERHHPVRVRVVAFSADDVEDARLTVEELTIAPVAVDVSLPASVTVPEGVPKALPVQARSLGAPGVAAELTTDSPPGLEATPEQAQLSLEGDETSRILVEVNQTHEGPGTIEAILDPRPAGADAVRAWTEVSRTG